MDIAMDEYVAEYGFENTTVIENLKIAMFVNKRRKDREKEND